MYWIKTGFLQYNATMLFKEWKLQQKKVDFHGKNPFICIQSWSFIWVEFQVGFCGSNYMKNKKAVETFKLPFFWVMH